MLLVLVTAATIAQEMHLRAVDVFGGEFLHGFLFQRLEIPVDQLGSVGGGKLDDLGLQVIAPQIAQQHPPGREDAGLLGDDDLLDAKFFGEGAGVHPAAAAEGDQGEVARVVAAIDRDQLDRVDHVVVGDAHDAARSLFLALDVEFTSARLIQGPIHRRPCRRAMACRRRNRSG